MPRPSRPLGFLATLPKASRSTRHNSYQTPTSALQTMKERTVAPNRPIHRPIEIRLQPPLVDNAALYHFPAPVRLFEILRSLDLSVQGNYEDDRQQLWKPDTLIAQSLNLVAYHPAILLGRGPKRVPLDLHTYDPVSVSHFAMWRLDLADSQGPAMGDDEASFALRALQLMVDDVTIFPPMVLDRAINRLISTSGASTCNSLAQWTQAL